MSTSDLKVNNENGTIRGIVKKPEGTPKGVILCLHGGPNGNLHGNTNIFDQIAEKAIPLNYVVIQFSMYGSAPSDGHQKQVSIRTQLIDYDSILEFTTKNFDYPIHVIGESAGVTIAALPWRNEPKSYVLLWPAFDLKDTDLQPYLSTEWWLKVDKQGFLDDNGMIIGKEFFIELLLTNFSECFELPNKDILIIHGQADTEVPYTQSIKALSNANGAITFVTAKEAGHGFKAPSDRAIVLDEIVKWLKRYNY